MTHNSEEHWAVVTRKYKNPLSYIGALENPEVGWTLGLTLVAVTVKNP